MSSASLWSAVLIGAGLLAIVALVAMNWALAPFFREVLHSGSVRQRQAVGGFILLVAVEAGLFAWMALA